jgi:DNA-binding beta-propeller fold protein YncE
MDLVSLLTSTTDKGGGVNPNAWDISKAYYDAGADAWDISKAEFAGINFSVTSQETTPTGVFFKPDGTKMYVIGSSGDDVNEYTLSTPWLVSSASYVQNFSVASQETIPNGLFFKPDGTKMYVIGSSGDNVNEYDLSSAWDISSASYLQNFSVATQDTTPTGLFFKPDGTKMYIIGTSADSVNEYNLSTPWDISTSSHVQSFSVATEEGTPTGLFFKPNGTKMYVVGSTGDEVNEYDLSSAWDISTASYVQVFSVSTEDTSPQSLFFHPDGSGFYVVGATNDTVYQFTIGGFDIGSQETQPQGLFFKPDGTKMYVIGSTGDDVNEYSLSSSWNILSASYVQNFSISAQDTVPRDVFFKPDGTKMYVLGDTNDKVYEYDLSSAWDISTASYVQDVSVAGQESAPEGMFFKPDGTKMYIVGSGDDEVNEYDLSTAWDVTSISYVQNFSISAQDIDPESISFKTDGTKMYILGNTNNAVYEYSLSSAWDISTASYTTNVGSNDSDSTGLFWKDDGSQFWIAGNSMNKILSYKISPT